MRIDIQNSSEITDFTADYIREKLNKLETFYDRIESATVFIHHDDGNGPEGHKVEVRLAVPGPDLYADHSDPVFEKALAEVIEKLRRQVKRMKEKQSPY